MGREEGGGGGRREKEVEGERGGGGRHPAQYVTMQLCDYNFNLYFPPCTVHIAVR